MFESKLAPDQRVKLSGFNNLTKILSFNLYDFCIALNEEQRAEYVKYIHDKYSAKKIEKIAERIVEIIERALSQNRRRTPNKERPTRFD